MANGQEKKSRDYPPKTIKFISIVFIVIGTLCFGFQITTLVLDSFKAEIACGIWGGFFLVITGIVGLYSASKRTSGWILAFSILCFFILLIAIVLLVQCSLAIDTDRSQHRKLAFRGTNLDEPYLATNCVRKHPFDCQYGWGYDVEWQKRGYDRRIRKLEASLVLNSIMIFFSLVIFGLAIWAIILCCLARAGEKTVDEGVFYSASPAAEKPPMVYLNHGAQFSPTNGLERSFDSKTSDFSQLSGGKPYLDPPPDYDRVYLPVQKNRNWAGSGDVGQVQLQHSFI